MLSTDDLRFLAEVVLNKVDFDPKEYNLDGEYLTDIRDALLKMAESLETTGEFEIMVEEPDQPKESPCGPHGPQQGERVVTNEGGIY